MVNRVETQTVTETADPRAMTSLDMHTLDDSSGDTETGKADFSGNQEKPGYSHLGQHSYTWLTRPRRKLVPSLR